MRKILCIDNQDQKIPTIKEIEELLTNSILEEIRIVWNIYTGRLLALSKTCPVIFGVDLGIHSRSTPPLEITKILNTKSLNIDMMVVDPTFVKGDLYPVIKKGQIPIWILSKSDPYYMELEEIITRRMREYD